MDESQWQSSSPDWSRQNQVKKIIRILIAESAIGIHLGRVCAELPSSERKEGMYCERPREENCTTPACALKGGADADGRKTLVGGSPVNITAA